MERALTYPYDRLGHDFVLLADGAQRLVSFNEDHISQSSVVDGAGVERALHECAPLLRDEDGWTATIASGSNAAAKQLSRKFDGFLNGRAIVVLEGVIENFVSVYSAHLAQYGAVPATLWPQQGAQASLACVILPNALLSRMHDTESLGENYGFFELPEARFTYGGGLARWPLHAYLSLRGALTSSDQPILLSSIQSGGADGMSRRSVEEMLEFLRERHGKFETVADLVRAIVADESLRQQVMNSASDAIRPLPLQGFSRIA